MVKKRNREESVNIQDKQRRYIIDRLNTNLRARHIPWEAGLTSVARMTYDEKKALFGGKMPNLGGFEYYVGGIFVMPDKNESKDITKASLNSTLDPYVQEWDWRNQHGKNWISPVKDQGSCGSCWAFATIGTLESYINLYYNRLLNYNLSEQELVSCSTSNGCGGGSIENALTYIEQNGIVLESCFSYSATNGTCSDKCTNPDEIISLLGNNSVQGLPETVVEI